MPPALSTLFCLWFSTLLYAVALLPRPAYFAALTVKPENQVINVGGLTTLRCSINTTYIPRINSAAWQLYRLDGTRCNIYTGIEIVDSCVDSTRFSISSPNAGQYDLIIADGKSADAGTYRCLHLADIGGESEPADSAHGVVVESAPLMTQAPPTDCALENDIVQLRCETNYMGDSLMPLQIKWTASDGSPVYSNGTYSDGTSFWSAVNLPATSSGIEAHTCEVTFRAPTSPTIPPTSFPSAYALNIPNYTSASTSKPYSAQHCPSVVSIKLDNGDEFTGGDISAETILHCSVSDASSNIITTYVWTDAAGTVINDGNSTAIGKQSGHYSVTCTATSSICSRPCLNRLTKTVTSTSYETTAQTPHKDSETTQSENGNKSGIHSNVLLSCLLSIVTGFCTLQSLST